MKCVSAAIILFAVGATGAIAQPAVEYFDGYGGRTRIDRGREPVVRDRDRRDDDRYDRRYDHDRRYDDGYRRNWRSRNRDFDDD